MQKYHEGKAMFVRKVKIVVSDLERSIDFYTNIIGLSVIKQEKNIVHLGVDGVNTLLILDEVKGAVPSEGNIGLYHFALLLEKRSEFAQILKHLVDSRYLLTGLSDHEISEAIYLQDPDNNGIEIAVDRHDENGDVLKLNSFGPKMVDYYGLMEELPNEKFTTLPVSTIMGHIHLHVNNMEKAKEFFVDGLGFEIQFDYHHRAMFVSSVGYHHHIGINVWNGYNAKRRTDNQAGLESYIISLPKEDITGIKERLKKLQISFFEIGNNIELFDVNFDKVTLEGR